MTASPKEIIARLARASAGGLVSVAKAAEALDTTSRGAATTLARLERSGWLARAQRGLYLVRPLDAAPGSPATIDDPWVLARAMFSPCYIGGWTAAGHWELTEQLFRSTFVATGAPRRKSHEERLSLEFHVVRIKPERLAGTTLVWRGTERIAISDRERTITDALVDPSWVGGVRHLAEILGAYRRGSHFDTKRLLARLNEAKSGAAFKRVGWLGEALKLDCPELGLAAQERRSQGVIRLDPAVRTPGKMSKRWGLWVNVRLAGSDLDDS